MPDLWEKIVQSDAIIIGSPIYWFRLNAQVYPFIDRIYGYISPDFTCDIPKGKKIVVALTCGGEDIEDMNSGNEYLKKVFQFLGFVNAGFIWQNNCTKLNDLANFPDKIKEAKQLGKSLVD
jgi:multimeric flavodoxin WrbA